MVDKRFSKDEVVRRLRPFAYWLIMALLLMIYYVAAYKVPSFTIAFFSAVLMILVSYCHFVLGDSKWK